MPLALGIFLRTIWRMLQITDLNKVFFDPGRGEVRAVDGVTLHCEEGVVVLVGANGNNAGKTTLLRLDFLLSPDSGSIHINGHNSVDDPDLTRRQLGYLSPSTRLYPLPQRPRKGAGATPGAFTAWKKLN